MEKKIQLLIQLKIIQILSKIHFFNFESKLFLKKKILI